MRFSDYICPLFNNRFLRLSASFMALAFLLNCGGTVSHVRKPPPSPAIQREQVPRMGHAIQAGAFSILDNAVRFTESLQNQGLEAYYFKDDSGLYKVRFGNFTTRGQALTRANSLRNNRIIDDFFIVGPEDYPVSREDTASLRKDIVKTARSFIGVPYRFGGTSSETGFDCSGLSMVSYRLNGLELPRTSRQQWGAGRSVARRNAMEGDLVFFDTGGRGHVSHVGVYIGNGQFIHAPRTGTTIRIDSISNSYFSQRYLGTRTYL